MTYSKASAEKAWLKWKTKEEKHLRELGVDEDTIQRLHAYDWEMFKAERNYQQRHIDIGTFPEIVSEAASDQPHSVENLLDSIENERLYQLLRKVDPQTLQMLFSKVLAIPQKKLNSKPVCQSLWYIIESAVCGKNIKKIYKNQRFSLFSVAI